MATALIYPTLYEGFGLPVLEAMSCGTPVITSDNSSLPEVGGDIALYIDPCDKSSIIRAMERFENEPNLSDDLRDRCIRQASRFTWEKCARGTVETYRRCLPVE
jgi:glycosyltransferase involved in cell wall biosynthesis